MDIKALRTKMLLNDDKQKDLAEALGITETTMSLKMQGKYPFKVHEIAMIKKRYNLLDEEVGEIFFEEDNR